MLFQAIWKIVFFAYFLLLSWQLLSPVTIVNPGSWDKLIHFTGFFVLAGLATLAWWKPGARNLVLVLIAYAAITEILQHFIPGRSFSVLDWVADSVGVVVATAASLYVLERIPFLRLKPH